MGNQWINEILGMINQSYLEVAIFILCLPNRLGIHQYLPFGILLLQILLGNCAINTCCHRLNCWLEKIMVQGILFYIRLGCLCSEAADACVLQLVACTCFLEGSSGVIATMY